MVSLKLIGLKLVKVGLCLLLVGVMVLVFGWNGVSFYCGIFGVGVLDVVKISDVFVLLCVGNGEVLVLVVLVVMVVMVFSVLNIRWLLDIIGVGEVGGGLKVKFGSGIGMLLVVGVVGCIGILMCFGCSGLVCNVIGLCLIGSSVGVFGVMVLCFGSG